MKKIRKKISAIWFDLQVGNVKEYSGQEFLTPEALTRNRIKLSDPVDEIDAETARFLHKQLDLAIAKINHSQRRMAINYEELIESYENALQENGIDYAVRVGK